MFKKVRCFRWSTYICFFFSLSMYGILNVFGEGTTFCSKCSIAVEFCSIQHSRKIEMIGACTQVNALDLEFSVNPSNVITVHRLRVGSFIQLTVTKSLHTWLNSYINTKFDNAKMEKRVAKERKSESVFHLRERTRAFGSPKLLVCGVESQIPNILHTHPDIRTCIWYRIWCKIQFSIAKSGQLFVYNRIFSLSKQAVIYIYYLYIYSIHNLICMIEQSFDFRLPYIDRCACAFSMLRHTFM